MTPSKAVQAVPDDPVYEALRVCQPTAIRHVTSASNIGEKTSHRQSFSAEEKWAACQLLQQAGGERQTAAVLAALKTKGFKRSTVYSWKKSFDDKAQEAADTGGPELTANDVFGGKRGRPSPAIKQPSAKRAKAVPSLPGEVLEAIDNISAVATDGTEIRRRFSPEQRLAACEVMALITAPEQLVEVVKLLEDRGYSRGSLYNWRTVYEKAVADSDGPPVASEVFSARTGRPRAIDEEHLQKATDLVKFVQASAGSQLEINKNHQSPEAKRILNNSLELALANAATATSCNKLVTDQENDEKSTLSISKRTLTRYKREVAKRLN